MPLIPSAITAAMDSAFVAGMVAMEAAAEVNSKAKKEINSKGDIKAAGAAAFAAIAGPAIDAYIRSQTITIPPGQVVATAGSAVAQAGATTAPSPPAIIL